ncbi:hypothetical protein [Modestobacter sp. URMC 112]
MRSFLGMSTPSATVGTALVAAALAVGSLAACSSGGDTADGAAAPGAAAVASASPVATAPPSSVTVDTTEVATDPPARDDGAAAGGSGEDPGEKDPAATDAGGGPRSVAVTTTYAGVLAGGSSVEAGGYVGVVEQGGTCTLTLTRDDTVRTASAEGTPDATTTACGGLAVPLSDLASGTWEAVLGYESDRSSGEAPAVEVEVP